MIFPELAGIYSIKNKIENKMYVGSSINIGLRWKTHISELNRGRKNICNSFLQRSWNKYGEDNFEFSVLEIINDANEEILIEKENYYIRKYNTMDRKFGYNLKEAGRRGRLSQESKDKISKSNKGKTKGIPRPDHVRKKISDFYKNANKDQLDRNRMNGEKNGMSKLTEEDVLYIWRNNLSGKEIMEKFPQISKSQAYKLAKRIGWEYLKEKI